MIVAGSSLRRQLRRLLPILAAVTSSLVLTPSAFAAGLGFGGPQVNISGLQCVTPGNCTSIGTYYNGLGHGQAVAWTEASGRWAPGVRLLAPSDAAPNAFDAYGAGTTITSLSCPAAGDCAAVGDYRDRVGNVRGVLYAEHSGRWSHPIEAKMPGDLFNPTTRGPNGHGSTSIPAVSCSWQGHCVAVGSYLNRHGAIRTVMFIEDNGSWGPAELVAPPAGGATGDYENAQLAAVSCSPDGTCTAIGSYLDDSGNAQGWAVTIQGGTVLTSVKLPMPSGPDTADPSPSPRLTSISCVDAADCAAVGNYSIDYNSANNGNLAGLLLVEHAGSWQATEAALPADAAPISTAYAQDTGMLSVDCPDANHCSAVGYYSDVNSNIQGEVTDESSGTWTTPQEVTLPGNASSDIQTQLVLPGPVSCSSAGHCAASAVYADVTGNERPLLVVEPGPGQPWSSTTVALPANEGPTQEVGGLAQVSCPRLNPPVIVTANDCTVMGLYQDTAGKVEGFAITETPAATWGRPAELQVPGPTRADLRATLAAVLTPKGSKSRLKQIRKHKGYSFRYRAIEAGTLTITWRIRYQHHRRIVGRVRIHPLHRGRSVAKVSLTGFGRDWLNAHSEVRIRSTVSFRHRQEHPVIARSRFTIRK